MLKWLAGKLAVASVLSLCLMPVQKAQAQCNNNGYNANNANYANSSGYSDYYDPNAQDYYEDPASSSWLADNGLLLLGAAALGAAAGAGAGFAAGGCDSCTATFPRDTGNTLTFGFPLAADIAVTGPGATITNFVVAPDGRMIIGATLPLPLVSIGSLPAIVIPNPEFGTYTAGIQINQATPGLVSTAVTVVPTATASRDGSVTSFGPIAIPAGTFLTTADAQGDASFAYGTPPVP